MAGKASNPFVYWAQTESHVFLEVDVKDVKTPNVDFERRKIVFNAEGTGAEDLNTYDFEIAFYSDIDLEGSSYNVHDSKVDFNIAKVEKTLWPQLTSESQVPEWLKINPDRLNADEKQHQINLDQNPGSQKKKHAYSKEHLRKTYLIFYNLMMGAGFLYVCIVSGTFYLKNESNSYSKIYPAVRHVLIYVQLLQLLEVAHCMFGYTSGSALVSFAQISGRCIILIGFIESEPRMQTRPILLYLFFTWSLIESVRYPYYLSVLLKIENYYLTWLRYTLWIFLYPIGFFFEGTVIFTSIPYVEETERFSWALPNRWNFTFNAGLLMRLYLFVFLVPVMYFLTSVMYRQRKQKLAKKSRQKCD